MFRITSQCGRKRRIAGKVAYRARRRNSGRAPRSTGPNTLTKLTKPRAVGLLVERNAMRDPSFSRPTYRGPVSLFSSRGASRPAIASRFSTVRTSTIAAECSESSFVQSAIIASYRVDERLPLDAIRPRSLATILRIVVSGKSPEESSDALLCHRLQLVVALVIHVRIAHGGPSFPWRPRERGGSVSVLCTHQS